MHTNREAHLYRARGVTAPIHVTGTGPQRCGRAHSIAWAYEQAWAGEWMMFVDDDVSRITAMAEPWYQRPGIAKDVYESDRLEWNWRMSQPVDPIRFVRIVADSMIEGERIGANLIGFSPTNNPFFRLKKWSRWSFVRGWMFLVRRVEGRAYRVCHQDDNWATLDHLADDGQVLVNRFLHAHGNTMAVKQDGGHGHMAARKPAYDRETRQMLAEYPDLVRVKDKRYGDITLREPALRRKKPPL